MNDLFGTPLPPILKNGKPGKPKTNPLIKVYGEGPPGAKCSGCQHQFFREFASKYSKCELRDVSSSPKTDHNSRYSACGKYVPKPTGEIWTVFKCRNCGRVGNPYSQKQEHHDARMVSFGWQKSEEQSINGNPIWIRPVETCTECPPKPRKRKK